MAGDCLLEMVVFDSIGLDEMAVTCFFVMLKNVVRRALTSGLKTKPFVEFL